MAGRKRKPEHLKVIEGTFRKDRDNEDKPKLPAGAPKAPKWLPEAARGYYDLLIEDLTSMDVLAEVDRAVVAAMAVRELELEILNEDIEKHGMKVIKEDKDGNIVMVRKNPSVAQRNEVLRHLIVLSSECGLTPASRSKVSQVKRKEEKKNPFANRK